MVAKVAITVAVACSLNYSSSSGRVRHESLSWVRVVIPAHVNGLVGTAYRIPLDEFSSSSYPKYDGELPSLFDGNLSTVVTGIYGIFDQPYSITDFVSTRPPGRNASEVLETFGKAPFRLYSAISVGSPSSFSSRNLWVSPSFHDIDNSRLHLQSHRPITAFDLDSSAYSIAELAVNSDEGTPLNMDTVSGSALYEPRRFVGIRMAYRSISQNKRSAVAPVDVSGCKLLTWGPATAYTGPTIDEAWSSSSVGFQVPWSQVPGLNQLWLAEFGCDISLSENVDSLRVHVPVSGQEVRIVSAAAAVADALWSPEFLSGTDSPAHTTGHCMMPATATLRLDADSEEHTNHSGSSSPVPLEVAPSHPRGARRGSVATAAEPVAAFRGPLVDLNSMQMNDEPAPMVDWTVSIQRNPTGMGCEAHKPAFERRHHGNTITVGDPLRTQTGMNERDWNTTAARTAGCITIEAVPRFSDAANADQGNVLLATVVPFGKPLLPDGTILNASVPMNSSAMQQVTTRRNPSIRSIEWGPGDLFGASFAKLPPGLSGASHAPASGMHPTVATNASSEQIKRVRLAEGLLVSLIRPPPIRVHSSRFLVGAPRAWAHSGRRGAVGIVDYTIDLLDRPMALDQEGNRVMVDAQHLQGKEIPGISPADLEARYVVSASPPTVLLAPLDGGTLRGAAGPGLASLDTLLVASSAGSVSLSDVFVRYSYFGASVALLGESRLPPSILGTENHVDNSTYARTVQCCSSSVDAVSMVSCNSTSIMAGDRLASAGLKRSHGLLVAIGAPAAGKRREGAVVLAWLGNLRAYMYNKRSRGLDASMLYSRDEPGSLSGPMPEVLAFRVVSVAPAMHCVGNPSTCLDLHSLGFNPSNADPTGLP